MKKIMLATLSLMVAITCSPMVNADRGHNGNRDQGYRQGSSRSWERNVSRRGGYYHPGRRFNHLPSRHHHFVHGGQDYYYFGGNFFYRPYGYYEVIRPPYGARVPYLPPGYVSFFVGPSRYFYVNYTYYLWDDSRSDYLVVEEPEGAEISVIEAAGQSRSEIFAYPSQGQSSEQQDRDYYDCHVWSVEESGYDPSLEGQNEYKSRDYRRAMTACLEGRGYSVR